ncbi:MAG: CDP-alcohol phosphatidyltransferase family protein [Erysipelotrichaceae bacterium]|nr:CDP-alcohol phosphatidyltransferase family protein [Erysipelotrichaceae bacterium]MBR6233998.1 CDP-alcohol phosphatidyltransferase family protein [Erysipelotrichaceae bacterium]
MKKNMANIITLTRLIGTIALFFTDTMSAEFFVIYIWCGISDILDGFIARKTNTISALGSKLDSISDISFYTMMMYKILPFLRRRFPRYIWILIYAAVGVRILCYIAVAVTKGYFESRHTIMNKINSGMMFFLPFLVNHPLLIPFSLTILAGAFISNIEEIIHIVSINQVKGA